MRWGTAEVTEGAARGDLGGAARAAVGWGDSCASAAGGHGRRRRRRSGGRSLRGAESRSLRQLPGWSQPALADRAEAAGMSTSSISLPTPRRARRARSPSRRRSRAGRPAGAGRRALPVGAQPQRLRQRVLQRRRALDEHQLARVPVRLVRLIRRDDGRQAAARAVGAGAVGARLRLQLMEPARAAGADGRGDGRAHLRHDAPAFRPRRRVRRGPRARR